jgi:tetratricopeptide (TPR) repeat protein
MAENVVKMQPRFTMKHAHTLMVISWVNGTLDARFQAGFLGRFRPKQGVESVYRTMWKKEQGFFMAANAQHEYAVYLFQQGYYEDAVKQLDEVLREEETGERWSDWATAQFALSRFTEAERGFRRALELSPELADAAVNFGTLLVSLSRWKEAIAMLEGALPKLEPEARVAVSALAEQCRAQLVAMAQCSNTR